MTRPNYAESESEAESLDSEDDDCYISDHHDATSPGQSSVEAQSSRESSEDVVFISERKIDHQQPQQSSAAEKVFNDFPAEVCTGFH